MQHNLKRVSKKCCLFILGCVLLSMSLVGWQHAATAHADTTFDLYVWTSLNQVWGHNIGDSGVGVLLDNGHTGVFTSSGCCDTSNAFGPITAVIARGTDVWEQRGHFLFQLAPGTFCSYLFNYTGWCLIEIDDNPATTAVVAGGNGQLYQLHTTGSLWEYDGGGYHSWTLIDNNSQNVVMVAGANKLFLYRGDGTVWKFLGSPFNWLKIDSRSLITGLALTSSDGTLFEMQQQFDSMGNQTNGAVLQGFGPFSWQYIDLNLTDDILASNTRIYQMRRDGSLLISNGGSFSWSQFDSFNGGLTNITIGNNSDAFYKQLSDNSIWGKNPQDSQYTLVSPPVSGQFVGMSAPING